MGCFALSVIDRLSKAILFEPNRVWLEPLQMTFKTMLSKVEIVPLALGCRDAGGVVKLDTYFRERLQPNYIQVDVDGAEWAVLQGARQLLKKRRNSGFRSARIINGLTIVGSPNF